MADICVVIPTFNRLPSLRRAVRSALDCDGGAADIVVVDDGSTDGTLEWLDAQREPRLRVLATGTRGGGPSAARNRGLEAASAPLVAFLDSDDAYRPGRLSMPVDAFARRPDLAAVLCDCVMIAGTKERSDGWVAQVLESASARWVLTAEVLPIFTSGVTVRRDVALAAGGFSEQLRRSEDREFLIRIADRGPVQVVPGASWEKHLSADGLSDAHASAGLEALKYFELLPDLLGRYRKIGRYLAVNVLTNAAKAGNWRAVARDLVAFRRLGLLPLNPFELRSDVRDVQRFRRAYRAAADPGPLAAPRRDWR